MAASLPPATGTKNSKGEDVYVTNEMIDNLLNDQRVGENLRAAEAKRRALSKEEFHKLRALAKRDLYFLSYSILGYDRLSPVLHGGLCKHIKDTAEERFHEYLMPRGHFKSTVITIGHSIQVVLPYTKDDAAYDYDTSALAWPCNLGTDCRLLIAHETHESASRFLFSITAHVTSNPLLMALFPEIVPDRKKHRVNKWELELPRSDAARGYPEPTIDTLGVGGKSQGRHYNYIKLDDIYGDKARDSAAESQSTLEWFDNIQAFFSTFKKDHMDLIGTRYSYDDVYAHAHERYGKKLITYSRRVEEWDEQAQKKLPIFPEEFDEESLNILRKNRKIFSAQYENDPDTEGKGFDPAWKKYFYWIDRDNIAVFIKDTRTRVSVRDLDICILIDPGSNGKSGGFAVTGVDYVGRVFVLVAMRIELSHPALVELIFNSAIRWQPRTVAIESDLFASVYEHWLYSEMSKRGIRFHITPVYTMKRAKDDRILGLSTYMASDQFFMNEQQTDLVEEFGKVGKTRDVHIFDALGYGPEVWRPGYPPGFREQFEQNRRDVEEGELSQDNETGYSEISYGEA